MAEQEAGGTGSPEGALNVISDLKGIRGANRSEPLGELTYADLLPHHEVQRSSISPGYDVVDTFFDEFARSYDQDVSGPYWQFAHRVLEQIVAITVPAHFQSKPVQAILDAGCGTGIWASYLATTLAPNDVCLVDRNEEMLKIATRKGWPRGVGRRIVHADLEQVSLSTSFQMIVCFHNVIGFARSTYNVLRTLSGHLGPGGLALIMAPNVANALRIGEVRPLPDELGQEVRYREDMPWIYGFTPDMLKAHLLTAGFDSVKVIGFPVRVQPSPTDALVYTNARSGLRTFLARPSRAFVLQEARYCLNERLALHGGSSLLALCTRR